MSVVCARVYKDRIGFAADSIVVRGWSKDTKGDFCKLSRINDVVIGGVGDAEESGLMWHYMATHKPDRADEKSVLEFFIEFSRWKRELTGNGDTENDYLIGYDGHVFYDHGALVYEIRDYCAIGAGDDFANAALYLGHSPREAVRVACDLCCMVAEPIMEESMKRG